MAKYLIVNSRDLQEYSGSQFILNLAGQLRKKRHEVTFFLIENGVLSARKGSQFNTSLQTLSKEGTRVLAEDLSLKARGISQMGEGISPSNMEELATLVMDGCDKVMWY